MARVTGVLMAAAVVLLTIYLFNRFSGRNVAALGVPADKK